MKNTYFTYHTLTHQIIVLIIVAHEIILIRHLGNSSSNSCEVSTSGNISSPLLQSTPLSVRIGLSNVVENAERTGDDRDSAKASTDFTTQQSSANTNITTLRLL